MNSLVVENLGKRYVLAAGADEGPRVRTWLRSLAPWVKSDPAGEPVASPRREFWALQNATFQVPHGTVLGIVGANGAGKSTLLKILGRVILPTTGHVSGRGRVVSLLELGAGFDPDMSARENIIMNAALHGIPKGEVLSRLEPIMAFAEADQFIETPLKHFSSGMYLRLAFSVAINMNPSILLADEILAVGDIAFQERCLQRVQEEAGRGLTVLFVSHDMEAITRICNRVMWLHKGEVRMIGEPEEVVAEYQESVWSDMGPGHFERGRDNSRFAAIRGVKLLDAAGNEIGAAPTDQDVQLAILFEAFKTVAVKGSIDLSVQKQMLFRSQTSDFRTIPGPGFYELRMKVPAHLLSDITYQVSASLTTLREGQGRQYRLMVHNALSFIAYRQTQNTEAFKARPPKTGLIAPRLDWELHVTSHSQDEQHVLGA